MPDPASDLEPTLAARVIEATLTASLLSFARLGGGTLHDGPASAWVDAGVPDAAFNAVVAARFRAEAADAQIAAVLAHFRRPGLAGDLGKVGPSAMPADSGGPPPGARPGARGGRAGHGPRAAAVRRRRLRPPPAWRSRRCGTPAAWPTGSPCGCSRCRRPGGASRSAAPAPAGAGRRAPLGLHLGRLAGAPVATAVNFTAPGGAVVHHVVTLPAARRRGIGTAMTARALREARTLGCSVGVLTASPDGLGLYRRLGFRVYCQVRCDVWAPDRAALVPTKALRPRRREGANANATYSA